MPPFSGFVGKLLILDATRNAPDAALVWVIILGTSLLLLIGYARAGSIVFWKTVPEKPSPLVVRPPSLGPALIVAILIAATAALSVFAGPMVACADATARQLTEPSRYVEAVLGAPATKPTASPGAQP